MTLNPVTPDTRSRVERERTDTGLGPGWVALVDRGAAAGLEAFPFDTWAEAFRFAWYYTYATHDTHHTHTCTLRGGGQFHMMCECRCGHCEVTGPGPHTGLWGSAFQV